MSNRNDPLEESDETIPANPGRRRTAMIVGLLLAVAVLTAMIWFWAENTETHEPAGLLGLHSADASLSSDAGEELSGGR